jgi:hypothetical protein
LPGHGLAGEKEEAMKYRPQRGGLADSMKEVIELEPTIDALASHLAVPAEQITVEPYCYDDRIGWHTQLVSVRGMAIGFTDSPIRKAPPSNTLTRTATS